MLKGGWVWQITGLAKIYCTIIGFPVIANSDLEEIYSIYVTICMERSVFSDNVTCGIYSENSARARNDSKRAGVTFAITNPMTSDDIIMVIFHVQLSVWLLCLTLCAFLVMHFYLLYGFSTCVSHIGFMATFFVTAYEIWDIFTSLPARPLSLFSLCLWVWGRFICVSFLLSHGCHSFSLIFCLSVSFPRCLTIILTHAHAIISPHS